MRRLDSYQDRVNEGKDLAAAVEYARYILWSKLAQVMRPHDCDGALKVDSSLMRWKAEELQRSVCDLYSSGKYVPRGEQAQLDRINQKLDLIAGRLSQVVTSGEGRDNVEESPTLQIVPGGAP